MRDHRDEWEPIAAMVGLFALVLLAGLFVALYTGHL